MFDKDNSGTINFDEFGALWKYVTDWQQCFKVYYLPNILHTQLKFTSGTIWSCNAMLILICTMF